MTTQHTENPFLSWDEFESHVLEPTKKKHEKLMKVERLNHVETKEKERLEDILGKARKVSAMIKIMAETCQQVELFLHHAMPIINKQADLSKMPTKEVETLVGCIDKLGEGYEQILERNKIETL